MPPPSPSPSPPIADCTGVLVAGGRANRLGGVAKGLLRIGGEPIVARSLRVFRSLFPHALLVTSDGTPYAPFGARVIGDVVAGKGAPGGLHAALSAATTPWVFTAACDMPFLRPEPIAWLASRRADAPAVAVIWDGRLEPLHAFWSREALPELDRLLRAGEPSMWAIATAIGARLIPAAEWEAIDPGGRSFANVNTPEDAARLGVELPGPG